MIARATPGAALSLCLALPAGAQGTGDAEYGEYLASECAACHPADGTNKGIPAINGWYPDDFVAVMNDYQSEVRVHPVMNMIASRLGDEEIAALAAYFATLEP